MGEVLWWSVEVIDRSVVAYRGIRGLYRVSKKRSEVLKEGIVGVGV